ncbi:MAG: hypothetical protein GY913_25545 [Proteobacteria bacterium]|nr:hypothetical protein [Pseudomonadota bacterium]
MLALPLFLSFLACGDKDPTGDSGPTIVTDEDGDGFDGIDHGGDDCDDGDATVNPGADEVCDEVDNNCDGVVDEDTATDASTWYQDADGDGAGVIDVTWTSCAAPSNYVSEIGDCDDTEALAYPGADEVCDDIDNNCNGAVDENTAIDAPTWYTDNDGDDYGDANYAYTSCSQPDGYVDNDTDCNDTRSDINLDGIEICDGLDNDCDGDTDEDDAADASIWYVDSDSDGYGTLDGSSPQAWDTGDTGTTTEDTGEPDDSGDSGNSGDSGDSGDTADTGDTGDTGEPGETWVYACEEPSGYAGNADDCDDTDGAINPDGVEVCDTVDNDCDGTIDGSGSLDAATKYFDDDRDGYGDPSVSLTDCTHPAGYVADNTDCDDTDQDVSPGATEYCNDIDDDCDSTIDEDDADDADTWYADDDADGYGDSSDTYDACDQPSGYVADNTDCDDTIDTSNPGADEICEDSADNDCDGTTDECAISGDLDAATEAEFGITGTISYQYLGTSVGSGADIDGDGTDDFAIGAPGYDGDNNNDGAVFVFYGGTTATTITGADFYLNGPGHSSGLGEGTWVVDDLGNDGDNDVVVSGPSNDLVATNGGSVWIHSGPTTSSGSIGGVELYGTSSYLYFGEDVGFADLSNDGYGDVIVSAPGYDDGSDTTGAAYIFLGPVSSAASHGAADVVIYGGNDEDEFGSSVAGLGDNDGDGAADVAVGAHYLGNDAGAVYVFHGPWAAGSVNAEDSGGYVSAENAEDLAGNSVASAGDHDGDGYADMLVGAPYADADASEGGATYLVLGPTTTSSSLSASHASIEGSGSNDQSGSSLLGGFDADGDGNPDVAIGAPNDDDGGTNAGAVYLFYGPLTSGSISVDDADATVWGSGNNDQLGWSATAGDTDADGYDDLITGARRDSTSDTYAGAAYLFRGDER